MSDGFILAGETQTTMFQIIRVMHALAAEVNTPGLKMARGSIMNLAAGYCGSSKRTKRGVLTDYVKWLQTIDTNYVPSDRVALALKKPKK